MDTWLEYGRRWASPPRWRSDAPWAIVRITGSDAPDFLQRLCSQDVIALGEGECRPAAFLDGKGKLQATCTVGRCGDEFWLETAGDRRAALAALLDRYHFTEQLDIAQPEFACGEIVGPAAELGADGCAAASGGMALTGHRGEIAWRRIHAEPAALAGGEWRHGASEPLDAARAELLRICAGIVAVGRDTDERTLAMEANLDDHVSHTKGCYTGQEIVARIQTYGHVNRKLVGLHVAGGAAFEPGTHLVEIEEGDPVGRVMTSAPTPEGDARLALGYLPKDFWGLGTELRLGELDGPVARVIGFGD